MTQATILQIIPELGPGGAEQGCLDMAGAIVKAGGRALVASYGGDRLHELARTGAEHIQINAKSKNPLTIMRNAARLKGLIKKYEIDIVHARSRAPAWSAMKACKGTHAHYMTTCHAPYNISGGMKRRYNNVMAQGERVIAISGMVRDYLRKAYGTPEERIRLVHRGTAMERFHPGAVTAQRVITLAQQWRIPDGANVVMLPGRLTRWKGQHVLIEAMKQVKGDNTIAVIIGSDQGREKYRTELESAIEEHGLSGRVRLVDHCTDMPAAYMLACVVVSASIEPEGFGRVPVEAQAMGRPIVATDHGGAQETIKRGETGWLIPPDDADSLAKAVNEALALDAGQRDVLAARSMAHVAEHFSRDVMVRKTLAVYNELLEPAQQLFLPDAAVGPDERVAAG